MLREAGFPAANSKDNVWSDLFRNKPGARKAVANILQQAARKVDSICEYRGSLSFERALNKELKKAGII